MADTEMASAHGAHGQDGGKRLARRLNQGFFVLFGGWLALVAIFWLRALGPMRPFDVLPLDVFAAGWLAASLLAAVIATRLPVTYYQPSSLHREARLYRALGIRAFRAVITDGDLVNRFIRRRHPGYVVHDGPASLEAAVRRGFEAERAHHALWWFGLGSAVAAGVGGWSSWCVAIMLGNVVGNLLPIILQRYTRARLDRLDTGLVRRTIEAARG